MIIYSEKDPNELYKDETVYILHYPRGYKSSYSMGKFKGIINTNSVNYDCETEDGSSDSPVLRLMNYKAIGIHTQKGNFFNQRTLIKFAIEEFQKKVLNSANNNSTNQQQNISANNILNDKNLFPNIPEWLRLSLFANYQCYNDLNINQHLKQDLNSVLIINNNFIEITLFNNEEMKDLYF